MKGSLMTGFRALAFALGAFLLLALGGIKIRSSTDVALFILGIAAFWVLFERFLIMMRRKQNKTPNRAPGH